MNCSEAKLKLEPCASGTLPAEERIALEEHLAICEGCRLELELTRAVLGSPAFEGVEGASSSTPEATPPIDDPSSGSEPQTFGASSSAETDSEISFADLSLEGPGLKSTPGPATVSAAGYAGSGSEPSKAPGKAAPEPGAPAEAASNLWDFEPVDAHRDSGPPEGSLSFANEALSRKREDEVKRKATILRLALWGGGICGGLLLLGVSVWIALAFRQGDNSDKPSKATGGTPVPGTTTAPPPVPPPSAAMTDSTNGAATDPGAATTVPPTIDPGAATQPPISVQPPSGGDRAAQTPVDAQSQPAATKPRPKNPPKGATKPAPKPTPRDAAHDSDSDEVPAWSPSDLQPPPPPAVPRPAGHPAGSSTTPASGQGETPPSTAPQPNPGPGPNAQVAPIGNPPAGQPAGTTSPPPATATTPPPTNPPAAAPSDGGTPAPPPATGVLKPIDRLRIATENAAQNQDLVTLRKLKESWKALIQSVAGPDRSRAKREHADCLWSIQEITGRLGDRKEALAAYRDYVLTAPAGGTDSRSISRMRYLEESLAETK